MNTYVASICLVGNSDTGKSTFLNYLTDKLQSKVLPTIGVDFASKIFDFNHYKIKWQIWDTAGDDIFYGITSTYFRKITVFFLFFDINRKLSFYSLNNWIDRIKTNSTVNEKIILIGNKTDLERKVSNQEIYNFCQKYGIKYFEMSKNSDTKLLNNSVNNYISKIISKEDLENHAIRTVTNNTKNIKEYYESDSGCNFLNCIIC